jgi:hypothetical protein
MQKINLPTVTAELDELLEHGGLTMGNLERFNALSWARKNLAELPCNFDEETAREWVSKMNPAAKWDLAQTTAVMQSRGYSHRPCEFWAVMNMLYSDYGKMLAKYNADKPEVYADMADAWLTDPDAAPHKVGRYYRAIVAH